jgi:pyruvate/2-oxoglutarate dehydrogenase complex dihydrolipoamide acyltransferase (E2) component
LEVRSPRSGRVTWVLEVEEGEEVGEGMLAAAIEGEREARL